jgi:hypothetical protein
MRPGEGSALIRIKDDAEIGINRSPNPNGVDAISQAETIKNRQIPTEFATMGKQRIPPWNRARRGYHAHRLFSAASATFLSKLARIFLGGRASRIPPATEQVG